MTMRQKRAAAAVLAVVLLHSPAALRAQAGSSPRPTEHWVTTWATAQQLAPTRLPFGRGEPVQPPPAARVPATLKHQTVRMIAHASLGGRRVRVALSMNSTGRSLSVMASVRPRVLSTASATMSRS